MPSDRDSLFAAICAHPEEDTPRLMFADWLEEQGDEASATRAEFIRLQCELARLADDASDSQPVYEFLRDRDYVTRPAADWPRIDDGIHRRIALTMRADDLLRRHGESWLPKLPKAVQWGGFHRGFPHRVSFADTRRLKEVAKRLRAAAPAVTLSAYGLNARLVAQLADAGLLEWITGLELAGECDAGVIELSRHAETSRIRTLKVQSYGGSDEVALAVAGSSHWSGLRTLDFAGATLEEDSLEAVFDDAHLRGLRHLRIRGYGDWTDDTARALAAGGFSELVSLHLFNCGLDDSSAEILAGCPHFAKLRNLDLPHNLVAGRGVTALLTSPHLANVAFLGLEANPCNGLDAKRLAKARPGALRMFHAHGARLRTADVRALARCPRLRTLWYLDLDANNIGTTAVRELVRGFKDFCPPIMWLTHNRIDDRGAELLAKWKTAQSLDVLHLKYNAITDAGIRAMLASPYLANLEALGVDTADVNLLARLRHRYRHHDIHYG